MNRSYSKKRHIELVNEALERAYVEKNNNKKLLNEGNINLAMDTIEGYILGANLLVYPSEMRAVFNGLSDCQVKDLADKWLKKHGESLYTSLKDEWGGSTQYSPQIDRLVNLDKGYNHGYGGGCSEEKKDPEKKDPEDWGKIKEKTRKAKAELLAINAKKCGWGDDVKGYKDSGWKCPKSGGGGGKPSTTWDECSGTYHKGCKSSNGTIAKVQGCLGIGTDGKFGSITQRKVKEKIGKTVFTNDDVKNLCDEESVDAGGGGDNNTNETKPVTLKQL